MNTENEQKGRFDWHEFPEGRARFIGSVRGADQDGHEGFAIKPYGLPEMYGEIREKSVREKRGFILEIVSCGWPGAEWLGMPVGGMIYRFKKEELPATMSLIMRLVEALRHGSDQPTCLKEYQNYSFLGDVIFLDGWVALQEDGTTYA